ncbi:hypothetical protein L3Y34_002831 [Caenorhabditis briggsae]|uniref:Uncharacterized protein n=3 Tax=Caenorhabditis briggsae TaxID=6238 RepID=A0AAE9AAR7_CAEBR|nr:hypothetical protein L3Y34_002831 [Caenorhabditis briggsae]
MSVPCTQFNPFGSQDKPLKMLKLEMEGILQKFEEKSTPKGAELAEETKKFAKVMEGLADIVTNGHAHMIQPLVGEIAIPFSKLIVIFGGKSTDDTRSPELANLFRRMARFIQKVADLAQEPFNSDVLNVWGPIFEAFLTSKHNSFKENGALLWKKTFGSTKVPLQWPIGLRETLEKLPKRLGISLPPVAKRSQGVPLLFPDDDAMDGLAFSSEESDDFKQPNQVNDNVPDSQSSFQLSQQPAVNEMADKILIYHNKKLDPPKVPSKTATPTRKRTGRISLIDEDSCDYVPITATPPSGRRSKLTDRQKETLAQMSGPRTSINYMDEESQSGIQKSEGMKNAFRALNFEIGEDSVSVPSPKKVEKNDKKKEERPIKRSLFSSPIKALPVVSSNGSSFDQIDEEPEVKATSPQRKRVKIDESESSIGDSQQKRRYKNTPRHCVPAESRKSLRQSAEKLRTTTSSESSNDSQNTIIMSKSDDTDLEEVAKPIEESQEALREHNSAEPNNSFAILAPMYDLDVPEAVKSPPKTPRTPSILRGSKKAVDSPMTERKRNRVHFGEDSIPKDTVSSSMTPRRKQTFESKSPNRPMTASTIESRSNSLLDMSSRTDTSAFFPSLVGCQDKVDKILNSLVTILSKQMRDSAKKSLSSFGVTTIGDFASLSKSQIEKLTWIKGKVSGAKSTLAQYEKTWNSNKKSGEDEVDMSGASAPVVEEEKLQKVPEAPTQLVLEEQSCVVQSSENQEEKLQEVSEVTAQVVVEEKSSIVQTSANQEEKLQEVSEVTGEKSPEFVEPENAPTTNSQAKQGVQTQSADAPTASPPVETEGPTLQESVEVIEKSLEASQSPVSPMSTATSASKSEPLKIEGSTGVSHKSLAPIFIGKEIKKEYASPQKAFQRKLPNVDDFLEDARILHRICGNLISAHTKKQWPIDNSKVLSEIVRAAGTFSGIVKKRGDDEEWREMEYENNEESRTVEEEVGQLVKVYKRFSRNHTSNMSNSLPWGNVMDCINESAILLENIYTERTDSS